MPKFKHHDRALLNPSLRAEGFISDALAGGEGINRCTLARPRAKSSLARFSEHGISGAWRLSITKTAMAIFS